MKKYAKIFLGNILITGAYAFITVPNKIINGGVTSFSMIISSITGLNISILTDLFTSLLLLSCWVFLGKGFFLSAIFSAICYIGMFTLFHSFTFIIDLPLLLAVFAAGIMVGTGYYFCISAESTAIGFDTVAIILKKYQPKINLAKTILLINVTVLLLGLMTHGLVSVLTGVAFTCIQAFTLNRLLGTTNRKKEANV